MLRAMTSGRNLAVNAADAAAAAAAEVASGAPASKADGGARATSPSTVMPELALPMAATQAYLAAGELSVFPDRLDVLWAQRSDRVFLKLSLSDGAPIGARVSFLSEGDSDFVGVTWDLPDGTQNECCLVLAGRVDVGRCRWATREKYVAVLLPKLAGRSYYWPHLSARSDLVQGGVHVRVGVDWDLWKASPSERDSDDSDSDASEGPIDIDAVIKESNDFGYDDDSDISETGLDY